MPQITKVLLEKLYITEKKSIKTICKELDYKYHPLRALFIKYNIARRQTSVSKGQEKYISKELLKKAYLEEELSLREIAQKHGYHPSLVYTKLKLYDIPLRVGISWNTGKTKKDCPELSWGGNHTKNRVVWNKGLTKEIDARVKKQSETYKLTHKDFSGNKNPFSGKTHTKATKRILSLKKGGTGIPGENSSYGPEWCSKLREQIRKRDNYQCQLTGITEEENLMIHGRVLDVHHIDYNKQNNHPSNLIALSYESHKRTNYNRKYWKRYFITLMDNK